MLTETSLERSLIRNFHPTSLSNQPYITHNLKSGVVASTIHLPLDACSMLDQPQEKGFMNFYLWTLLMVVRGPRSFEDLKTVDSHTYETFHEACLRRGLLEDDGEWEMCLQGAADIKSGSQLCHLFTTLLLFCTPAQPNLLWSRFCDKSAMTFVINLVNFDEWLSHRTTFTTLAYIS